MSFRKPPSDVERMTSLRVGNLPFRTVQEDLLPLFEKYGDVGDIYLPIERGSGRSRGFAFVRYYDKRDAEDAMDSLNGRTYDGRDLRITIDPGRPSGGRYNDRRRSRSRSRSRSRDRYRRSRSRSDSRERRRSRSRSRSRSRDRRDRSDSRDRGDSRRERSPSGDRGRSGSKSRSRSR